MCVYQNVNAPNHALLEVRNHEDGTFELVALNTTYGSSQAGNATVTVKVAAFESEFEFFEALNLFIMWTTALGLGSAVCKVYLYFSSPLKSVTSSNKPLILVSSSSSSKHSSVSTENDSMFASPAVPTRSGRSVAGCAGGASGT